jgi:GntR family transcriptional regulator
MPLYFQIAETLRAHIQSGQLKPGEAIPTEDELQQLFGVSRATVRQAVRDLASKGQVRLERPRGTFVCGPRLQEQLPELISFSDEVRENALVPRAVVLHVAYASAAAHVAARLGVAEGSRTLRLDRLRLADEEPIALMYAHLAEWCGLTPDLDYTGSMHQLLGMHGIKVVDADQIIEATVAGSEQGHLLRCHKGQPLLKVERVTISADGRPVEHVIALYRADRYSYHLRLSRNGRGAGLIQQPA